MYEEFSTTLAETMWAEFDEIPERDGHSVEITDVSTMVVDGNFPWTVVMLETDAGITGVGEAYPSPGVHEIITDYLRPVLVGQPPTDVRRLYYLMRESLSGRGSQAGVGTIAISGVEIALWDAAGKIIDQPIYQLLGGKFRDSIRVYADCHAGEAMAAAADEEDAGTHYRPEAYADAAQTVVEEGFDLLKFDLDVQAAPKRNALAGRLEGPEIEHKRAIVDAVTEAVGDTAEVAVDLHWNFTVETAKALCRSLQPYDLAWVEDPIPPENTAAMRELSIATEVPILTGENRYGRHGFRDLIETQSVSYLAPDVPKTGGIAETKAIADLASTHYQAIVPHNIGSPIATVATAHLGAAVPNFVALEYHARDVPWWDDLILGDQLISEGEMSVPDAPGLGIEVDWDVMEAHEKT